MTSYCFKCIGFLCKECHEFHMKNKIVKDHNQNVLSLEDLKSKHMTLEKLADLQASPRCESHPEELCLFCCKTCDNLPVCVICPYGSHKNHDINDVGIIAAEQRENLKHKLNNIGPFSMPLLKLPGRVDRCKSELISNVREKKENFAIRYDKNTETVKREIMKIEENYSRRHNDLEEEKKTKLVERRKQMDEEMKQLKMKYNKICDEIKEENRIKLDTLKHGQEKELQKNREKLAVLEADFQTFIKTLERIQDDELVKLHKISQQIGGLRKRYENLKKTGYSVLKLRNDWTAVQCIPDICKAIEPLSKDMKKEFPELEKLSRVGVNSEIKEDEESPVNIEGIKTNECEISGITGFKDSNVVISGRTSDSYQSHITVINMNGKVSRRRELRSTCRWPDRYCAVLSEYKIATVSDYNEFGVLDIRDYSYIKRNISDVISSWPVTGLTWCVATDPVNNRILVGANSRDVYVFDDQLNHHHTLKLPEMIKYPRDMTVSDDNLLICDYVGKRACVVRVNEREEKLSYEFPKPDFEHDGWTPLSVCTDSNGLIYILWMTGTSFNAGKRLVTRYTKDGRQLLSTKQINAKDARCIVTVDKDTTEKLLVATFQSGKFHIYSIM